MQEGVVGIDLGGTSTKFGIVTAEGELLAQHRIPTDSSGRYEHFFQTLYEQIQQLHASVEPRVSISGIGIGAPSANFCTGRIEAASNLAWSGQVPVVELMEEYAGLPTALINDANASAVGEMLYGAARGMQNFISITLGTGLGCGIVANGELVAGCDGHAGEIGHSTVYHDGRMCSCGHRGCLETYVSAPGLVVTVQELLKKTNLKSELRDVANAEIDAEIITHAARRKDALALKAFEEAGTVLGLKLADIVACLNPEAIIISGGLAKAGSLILEPARKSMQNHLLDMFKNKVKVIPSSLTEKNAAILGAAASIWKKIENGKMSQI